MPGLRSFTLDGIQGNHLHVLAAGFPQWVGLQRLMLHLTSDDKFGQRQGYHAIDTRRTVAWLFWHCPSLKEVWVSRNTCAVAYRDANERPYALLWTATPMPEGRDAAEIAKSPVWAVEEWLLDVTTRDLVPYIDLDRHRSGRRLDGLTRLGRTIRHLCYKRLDVDDSSGGLRGIEDLPSTPNGYEDLQPKHLKIE
ncbi:hypothetical protein B0A50_00448 [Salinomyces thailandicus]|uniref:Uncharacterized protein n=1 Tax=Salinomyces thailandicus TaxID=706561 RepID=A0A4U0UFD8_9PEZI|nr:hypothetical protein B0A50_00448 [Salinomyces thailandica]